MADMEFAFAIATERGPLLCSTTIPLALCIIAFAMRLLVRFFISRSWKWDDTCLSLAFSLYLVTCSLSYYLVLAEPTGSNYEISMHYQKLIRAYNALTCLALLAIKLSLGIFFLRIFHPSTHKWERIAVYATLIVPTVVSVIHLGMTGYSCYIIVSGLYGQQCNSQEIYGLMTTVWAATDSISDLTLSVISVWALARAKGLSKFARISASALLVLGTTGGLVSVTRLCIHVIALQSPVVGVTLTRWYNIEVGLCIIATSLIALRPLVQRTSDAIRRPLSDRESGFGGDSRSTKRSGKSSMNLSTAATLVTEKSHHSFRSLRRISKDAIFGDGSKNSHVTVRACSEAESGTRRISSCVIADPGGLLSGPERTASADNFSEIVVTHGFDVEQGLAPPSPVGKGRTKSVYFGGVTLDALPVLPAMTRPPFARAWSSRN